MKIEEYKVLPNGVKVMQVTIEEGDFDDRFTKKNLNKVGKFIGKTFKLNLWSFGFSDKQKTVHFEFRDDTKKYPITIDFEEYFAILNKLNEKRAK